MTPQVLEKKYSSKLIVIIIILITPQFLRSIVVTGYQWLFTQ